MRSFPSRPGSRSALLLGVLLALACAPLAAETETIRTSPPPCSVDALDWLTGHWVADRGDRRVEEHWLPPAGGETFGINRTIEGSETTAWELLRIVCRQDRPTYLASPGGRLPPTAFPLDVEASELDRFLVFVNPEHDYPQRIEYVLEAEDRLVARISGGLGTAVLSWTFQRTAD